MESPSTAERSNGPNWRRRDYTRGGDYDPMARPGETPILRIGHGDDPKALEVARRGVGGSHAARGV